MAKGAFRQQVLRVREDAIVSSVNRLLAEKGFDVMTVDEVAADVGIAKASLYKHFASKEELPPRRCRVLQHTRVVRHWPPAPVSTRSNGCGGHALGAQCSLRGMPILPSQNSSLRAELIADKAYLDLLMEVSDRLGEWIVQRSPELDRPVACRTGVLHLVRACDPVPGVLVAASTATSRSSNGC
jgi:hypothetical protein